MALKLKGKGGLVSFSHPESIISEQYRTIRANIQFLFPHHQQQTLLVTSPGYGEGKSITVANLAISMAQLGKKILLVDADLRKPSIHTLFQLDHSPGLADVLTGETTVEGAVLQTEVQGLEIVTSGLATNHPAELLSSPKLEQMIDAAKKKYDFVLFDSSPILDVTDSRLLANQCEGTILVIRNGKTRTNEATEAKRLLNLAQATCLGVIFNYK
ncbi:MAG TPA: CpsD/CapB family tyrosine-protein kinase [Bacillales bacterium]|nr:CpsD/CapB family tyrosine-protein kinase [Bacillales bacterium]